MFNVGDFEADTDFERLALDRLGVHRVRLEDPSVRFDVRGRQAGALVQVGLSTTVGGAQQYEDLRRSLRPLAFGAAYKVLDLMVEQVLRANGATASRMRFTEKRAALASPQTILPPQVDQAIWQRLASIYDAFAEARDALTHRRAGLTAAGDLVIYDDQRQATDTLPTNEVLAFIAAIQAISETIIVGTANDRTLKLIAWHLNDLRARHGLPDLPSTDPMAGTRVLVMDLGRTEDGELVLDLARARDIIAGQPESFWDLELHSDSRVFYAPWDDVAELAGDVVAFDPALPPEGLAEGL